MNRAVDFTIETNFQVTSGEKLSRRMATVMRNWGNEYLRRLTSERMSHKYPHSGMDGVAARSGNLRRDWVTTVESTPVGPALRVRSHGLGNAYAGLMERGGTVRPTKSKFLWIPAKANQTASGVARVTPSQAIQAGGFISWKRGAVFFARPLVKTARKNTTHGLVPLFVLKKSVYVPPRLGAESLFRAMLRTLEIGILAEAKGAWNG